LPGQQKALQQVDPEVPQAGQLLRGLDPFGNHPDAEVAADHHDPGHDGALDRVAVDAAHQLHVELDEVRLEHRKQVETGIASAKVVDGGLEPHLPIRLDDLQDPVGLLDLLFSVNSKMMFSVGKPTRRAVSSVVRMHTSGR
jgi:hypothetical protein